MANAGDPGREAGRRAILDRVVRLGRLRRADKASAAAPRKEAKLRIEVLEERINHLEALLEGLQDAVHRESVRQAGRIGELERRTEPAKPDLSQEARERGI